MAKTKVKFIKGHPKYAYFVGDIAHLENARAKVLIDGNYVEVIAEKKVKSTK